jgi:hypothetical protein
MAYRTPGAAQRLSLEGRLWNVTGGPGVVSPETSEG